MPFRQRGSYGRPRLGSIIKSVKNVKNDVAGLGAATNLVTTIVNTLDNPATTTDNQVERGCKIFKIWMEWWYYGTSTGDTNDIIDAYIIKNPGNNLTVPNPGTVGTSNEKKFVIKIWKGLAGTKTTGGQPYSWKGWIKIPKVYQRFGIDDRLAFVIRSPTTGNNCTNFVYKWFT